MAQWQHGGTLGQGEGFVHGRNHEAVFELECIQYLSKTSAQFGCGRVLDFDGAQLAAG